MGALYGNRIGLLARVKQLLAFGLADLSLISRVLNGVNGGLRFRGVGRIHALQSSPQRPTTTSLCPVLAL